MENTKLVINYNNNPGDYLAPKTVIIRGDLHSEVDKIARMTGNPTELILEKMIEFALQNIELKIEE